MPTPVMNPIDLRQIPAPERHALIFSRFADLQPGQSLELINDHDPQPLSLQFEVRAPGQFSWNYLEQGPQVWRVAVGKSAKAAVAAGGGCCGGCCGG